VKITIVLPFLRLTGGSKVLVDLANGLVARGHEVKGVVPVRLKRLPAGLGRIEWLWRAPAMRRKYRWFTPRFELHIVPELDVSAIPPGDIVMASAWQTAKLVAACPPGCGARAYFVQDVETHEHPEQAGATYRLPLAKIATSDWIARELLEHWGATVDAVVPLGLDLAQLPGKPRPPRPARRFGMLYGTHPRKGFSDGLAAFEEARRVAPGLELLVLGRVKTPPSLPPYARGRWNVDPTQVASVYGEADAWIGPSRSEGWGLPPMEAMAMGCAVVTTRVGGTPYFAENEVTALVVEPGDVAGLARGVSRLAADGQLVGRLSEAGFARARQLTFESTVRGVEEVLARLTGGPRPGA
jgi:glycosyltransferase involved in cell wall biosynthesis